MKNLQNLSGSKILSKEEQLNVMGGKHESDAVCNCLAPDGTQECREWCEPCQSPECN